MVHYVRVILTVCPPVRGDSPQALVRELSPVQVDKLWYTVNSEIFARILFSRIALKYIFATLKRLRHDLPISVTNSVVLLFREGFIFAKLRMRSFTKKKNSRKIPNLQLFHTTNISKDLPHYETLHAKVGNGGLNNLTFFHILVVVNTSYSSVLESIPKCLHKSPCACLILKMI